MEAEAVAKPKAWSLDKCETLHRYGCQSHALTVADLPGNMHWMVKRPLNSLLLDCIDVALVVGRALHSAQDARNAGELKCFVVATMGGQGKSELCLRVAHNMESQSFV